MMHDPEQCRRCKQMHTQEQIARTKRMCAAFRVIPATIFNGEFDHRQPFEGDHGVRWEPREPGVKHPFDERTR